MDWPGVNSTQGTPSTHLSTFSGAIMDFLMFDTAGTGTSVWPSANRAILQAVQVNDPVTVTQMGIFVATQSGNVDVGIYNMAGTRLVSIGSTACGAAGGQLFDITDTYLPIGTYFLAMSCDNGVAAFQRVSVCPNAELRLLGNQQMSAAHPLPSTVTFANPGSAYVPWILGITNAITVL